MRLGAIALAWALICSPSAIVLAAAQTPASAPTSAPTPAQLAPTLPGAIIIPAGTEIEVELVDTLNSGVNHNADVFAIRLVEPIVIGGRIVVPAGAMGGGEVIDAAPSGIGGRQGRLTVSGRYLEINGERAPIRGMRLGVAGANLANAALGLSFVPVLGLGSIFLQGGDIELRAGLRGLARFTAPVEVREPPAQPEAVAATPSPQSPQIASDASPTGGQ